MAIASSGKRRDCARLIVQTWFIVVSAGNIRVRMTPADYLDRNDLSAIESPAQAWNALTVGAFTEKTTIAQASYRDWQPLGQAGDLSPCSRTSVLCGVWPIKRLVLDGRPAERPRW